MLVLSRNKGERIIIRDDIVITIVGVKGNTVRMGFEAPKDVTIHREEVYDAIQRGEPQKSKM